MPAIENDCTLCGKPLSGDHDGWDHATCDRVAGTGSGDEDLFCLEHQCEYYGDDLGAAQERWERTERLLEQAGLGEAV